MTLRSDIWPTHAYVPGKTPRHAEGAFDDIRGTAQPGMTANELAGCAAFLVGRRFIEAGFFWEAHEVLEPVWMLLPEGSAERSFVQGMIQLANGLLKLKMERPKAALRLAGIARELVGDPSGGAVMGVKVAEIYARIEALEWQVDGAI